MECMRNLRFDYELECIRLDDKLEYIEATMLECRDRCRGNRYCVGQTQVLEELKAEWTLINTKLEEAEKKQRAYYK